MSKLGAVIESVEKHEKFVQEQVKRARTDEKFGREMTERWNKIKAGIPIARAPTGLPLPRLALPEIDEAGEIARYLFGDGLPGEFPYLNGAYREMYLEPLEEIETGRHAPKSPNGQQRPRTPKSNGRQSRTAVAAGRTNSSLLRFDARGRHEQAFSFPERAPTLEASQHRLRRTNPLWDRFGR